MENTRRLGHYQAVARPRHRVQDPLHQRHQGPPRVHRQVQPAKELRRAGRLGVQVRRTDSRRERLDAVREEGRGAGGAGRARGPVREPDARVGGAGPGQRGGEGEGGGETRAGGEAWGELLEAGSVCEGEDVLSQDGRYRRAGQRQFPGVVMGLYVITVFGCNSTGTTYGDTLLSSDYDATAVQSLSGSRTGIAAE
ncbi:hypothetical protein VUR80DRAFT_426 [Thermomyces stellatus]